MRYLTSVLEDAEVSQVAVGCMRISGMTDYEVDRYLVETLAMGYNYYDHADIYGGGECERVFGEALKRTGLRDSLYIQTKCGIVPGTMYDHSKEHIISSIEGSLKRLGVERVDALLLHRPDILMEPEEVAEAFDVLYESGKVSAFGVSNHSPMQIELLKRYLHVPIVINQMQLSVTNATMLSSGANVNLPGSDGINYDGYLRDYMRLHGITMQPWSPLQYGFFEGVFVGNPKFKELNEVLDTLAERYSTTPTGIAIAWLTRLPERVQPVVGSTNLTRLRDISRAVDTEMTREEWYTVYRAAGYLLP